MAETEARFSEFDPRLAARISTQQYGRKPQIDGVRLIELPRHVDDGGSFSELVRLRGDGTVEALPAFRVAQSNYSEMQPGAIKAWHLHQQQEDLWFVPPSHRLLVGLLDVRVSSETCGVSMRFVLGDGRAQLVYIPAGVAHGVANLGSIAAGILYFVSAQFDPQAPDELRLPWDSIGSEFWQVERG